MSVNIKTASGLQKLSSNVTKNTIAGALGYTPANPDSVNADLTAHTTNTDIHVSLAEKDKFLDYKQLNNLPNIVDDESGEFSILDKNGNTALQVDSIGVTNVASLTVNGQDVATFMENTNATSNTHITDQVRHITAEERAHWNDKAKLEGAIQLQDTGDTFTILDNVGNAALQVTEDGTTDVAKLTIKGKDVEKTISDAADAVAANLTTHITATNGADGPIHIQSGERAKWNDTSKMEGNLQLQDEGKEFVISDNSGNVALQVTESGITQVADLEINGINTAEEIARVEGAASANLQAHTSRTDNPHHVTKAQVGLGNADNTSDADKPISTAQAAKNEALDSRIDDSEAALQTHKTTTVSDGAIHIQANDRTRWDDKSWHSLTDKPNIVNNDESDEFKVIDSEGNVAILVDAQGTTNVANLEINGVNTANEINRVETDLSARITNVTDDINDSIDGVKKQVATLIGDDADKSVRKIANEELCAQLLTGKADADFQTLEQMATWLEDHPEDAADMNRRIEENRAAIVSHDESATTSDGPRHIQQGERTHWNDKSWHSLTDKPNIVNNDQSTEFQIVDSKGNVAVQVDADGVTNVASLSIDGVDVTTRMDNIESDARTNLSNHTTRTDNPHAVTATQVGLGSVNNTSDADKPISNAQAAVNAVLQQGIDANVAAINSIKNGTDDAVAKNAEHADYADVWTTSRTITLDGDASGSVQLDGSQDVTLTVAVKDDSHNHHISISATAQDDDVVILQGTSQTNGVMYKASHAESTVEAGTYKRVTVDKYGHVTSADNPDESWSSIVGRPDITPALDGNDTEILVKDSSENVALQLDSTGVLNLAGATVNGIDVAVDYIDYTNDIAFDVTELVVS